MNKNIYLCLFLFCILLTSCRVVNTISIDYLQPADVSFPPEVRTVAIVNNTSQGDRSESLEKLNANKSLESDVIGRVDGNSKLSTENLANNVAEGNYFEQVIICDSALRSNDHFPRETKLSHDEIKELSRNLGADMILSLEKLNLFLRRGLTYLTGSYPQGTLDATVRSVVRVYLPGRAEPMVTISDTDSIHWLTGNWNVNAELVNEASTFAATLPIKHILPTWKSVTRYYYAGGSVEMRDAVVYIKESKWNEARKLWEQVYNRNNEKMKMRAAFNIALSYEMEDQLEEAKEWAEKATKIAEKKLAKDADGQVAEPTPDYAQAFLYLGELSERVQGLQKLNIQMNRFKDEN